MAKKPNINVVATGYQATDTINDNFNNVRNSFENTLSRDGSTPNAMEADLDLNSNDILNVNQITANDIVLVGVGSITQGPQGPQGDIGPQGPQGLTGPQGNTGATGATGRDAGVRYTFSTTITDADPGNGIIRFNNATIASVTQLYFDNLDADANTVTTWLDSFDDSTTTTNRGLIYMKVSGVNNFIIFQVNGAIVDGTGYRKVPVAYVSGTLPSNSSILFMFFTRTGNQGVAGVGDMTKAVYDTNDDGKVNAAVNADAVPFSGVTSKPTTLSGYGITDGQPLDTELTAIAGLTSAADRLPYFTGSGTAALATFTAAGRALVDDADATAQRATLGLVIGTNVQAYDAELAAIAGLTSAADRLPYFTGSGTATLATFTAAGRALVDDVDNVAQRATLGLTIGTNVQAYDPDLASIAGLTGTSGLLRKTAADTWTLDTNTYLTSLGVGSITQAWDADLDAISALTGTSGLLRKTALNTFDLGSVKTKMRVFTAGTQYVPSAGTTSILVYLTGAGGAGGRAIGSAITTFFGIGGSGAGTLIFSMDATPADTFQIAIGPVTSVTLGTGTLVAANGSSSTFYKTVSGVNTIIAVAPGGIGGESSRTNAAVFTPTSSATITAPNATYVAANAYLAIRGGSGEVGLSAHVSGGGNGPGGIVGGNGGSSFWGAGAIGSMIKGITSFASGANAIAYGSGGAAGVIYRNGTVTGSQNASGGAGAPGVCIIIEVLN